MSPDPLNAFAQSLLRTYWTDFIILAQCLLDPHLRHEAESVFLEAVEETLLNAIERKVRLLKRWDIEHIDADDIPKATDMARPYLVNALHFICYAHNRKRPPPLSIDSVDLEDHRHRSPADELARAEESDVFWSAFRTIDPDHQRVLILRYLEDLSYLEIADMENVAVGTVKSRLNRAKSELREALASLSIWT